MASTNAVTLKPGKYVALDFDSQRLRVVHFEATRGRPRIRALKSVAIPKEIDFSSAEEVGGFVGRTLKDLGLASRRVLLNVPRGQAVLKPLSLPAGTAPDELAGMVHFQIAKELPFAPEEAVVDFSVEHHVGSAAEEVAPAGVAVLVAAVRLPVVDFYRQVGQAAGVRLQRLGLRPYANMRCVDSCIRREPQECLALVNITADETEIDFFVADALAFSRSAAVAMPAGDDHGAQQKAVNTIVLEFSRSMQSFQAVDRGRRISAVLVAGETGLERELARGLTRRLGLDCDVLDPAEAMGLTGEADVSAFSAALGSALAPGDDAPGAFDFFHPKQPVVRQDTKKLRLAATVIALTILLVGSVSAGWVFLEGKEQRASKLSSNISKAKQQLAGASKKAKKADKLQAEQAERTQKALDALQRRVAQLRQWQADRPDWLGHWAYLSQQFPSATEAYIEQVKVGAGGLLTFTVRARQRETIHRLEEALDAVDGYRVRAKKENWQEDPFGLGYDYTSPMEIEVSPSARVELNGEKPGRPAGDASAEHPPTKRAGSATAADAVKEADRSTAARMAAARVAAAKAAAAKEAAAKAPPGRRGTRPSGSSSGASGRPSGSSRSWRSRRDRR